MRNLEDLIEDLMNRIEVCSATQDLDFLEDRIWDMRCEAHDAQDDELVVVYDRAIEHLAEVRFKLACDTTP
jgi:hypothetical protein